MFVKICGITNKEDALQAVSAGATHIGLIFAPGSPRCIDSVKAKTITEAIAGKALVVGVFQNQPAATIVETCASANLDIIQLHGNEDAVFCKEIGEQTKKPVIKTIVLENNCAADLEKLEASIDQYSQKDSGIAYLLFDKPKTLNQTASLWLTQTLASIASLEPKWHKQTEVIPPPYFFAGGLCAANLHLALTSIKACGVDVASGVESAPGQKDHALVKAFILEALADKVPKEKSLRTT